MNRKRILAAAVVTVGILMAGCNDNAAMQNSTATPAPTQEAVPTAEPTAESTVVPSETPKEEIQNPEPTETIAATPTPTPVPVADEAPVAEEEYSLAFSRYTGVYGGAFYLAMAADDAKAEIYYTLDGSNPETSETAVKYTGGVLVESRENAANVVSAVDPVLFSGNYNSVTSKGEFRCKIQTPAENEVDKCTVVRAVAKFPNGIISDEVSATYFIGSIEDHIKGLAKSCEAAGTGLAVISISTEYANFFDPETGIYVKGDVFEEALAAHLAAGNKLKNGEDARSLDANYKQKGKEWEREVRVSFMECTPNSVTEVLSQTCGIRVQGNYSRSDLQKGLRLYAREDYGKKNFKYAFFGEDYVDFEGNTMDKFKTLVLRNGGNCAFTAKFNDTYWQSLVEELDCGTQKSRPCVVYLNGEYWGLYILQEDYTDNHMENLYGVDNKEVVIYKGDAEALELGYKLDAGDIPEGEEESYYFKELLDFFAAHDNLESEEDYAEFCKIVDPQSLTDYFAVQCWINNKWDWPGKNWSMWRTISSDGAEDSYGDGRWRFLFYDMEFGGVSGASDAKTNTIKEDNYKPEGLLDFDTDNPAVLCFAYGMTNAGFRKQFNDTLLGLSAGVLKKEAALAALDEFEAVYGPLYDQFFTRYYGSGTSEAALEGGYASSKCIRDFLEKRTNYIQQMVDYVVRKRGE